VLECRWPTGETEASGKVKRNKKNKTMNKRILLLAVAATALIFFTAGNSVAGEPKPFNREGFAKAREEGKTVLVDFHADWCPVCKKQAAVLPQVLNESKFENVVVFKADYDKETELKKQLKVTGQSTLIVFKGDKEAGRGQGITTATAIGELLEKGL
jgi:thiol-disulfide isomerase/thioredoxin